ncbi:MAG: SPFH domain-containing protein [Candidatus Paceibacterota bacterium]|jgi:hypothetical protein
MNNSSSPELKPFNNPVTKGVLILVIALVGIGIALAVTGEFLGVIIASIGITIWWAGDTTIPTDPRTAGLLTIWGSFIEIGGKSVVIGGRTILADYFPFNLGVVTFEITNKDKNFPMKILSLDNVLMEGEVSVTMRPDIEDGVDYVQAGKMGNIILQLDDIVYEMSKRHGCLYEAEKIAKNSELISGPLRRFLTEKDGIFQQKSFGIEIVKVQARFDMPKDITDDMQQRVREKYQREGELAEYATDFKAAEMLYAIYQADPNMVEKPTIQECLEKVITLRLIRDQRVARIESTGQTGNLIMSDLKLDMGKGGKK